MADIAVIGAGLAGVVVARELSRKHRVIVFEKSRGTGGRIATRYAGGCEFDHGAQHFTARTSEFREYLEPLIKQGVIAPWHARFAELDRGAVISKRDWDGAHPHWVGVPRMNVIGKWLADGLNVQTSITVANIVREDAHWSLKDGAGADLGNFDWVIFALPAAQTAVIAKHVPAIYSRCQSAQMSGCFALMIGFDTPVDLPYQAALIHNADISWISVNSSKPDRPKPFTLVVHSTNAWAEAHMDDDSDAITVHMVAEASRATGRDINAANFVQLQRWRYANIGRQSDTEFVIDPSNQVAACGDWFIRGRIESAFTSAMTLLRALAPTL